MRWLDRAWAWIEQHPTFVVAVTVGSVGLLLLAALALPLVVARLPDDHFQDHDQGQRRDRTPGRVALAIGRNVLGWFLLLAGVAMLALPGQGLLTILVGLLLVDLPGKRRATRAILKRQGVRNTLQWLRRKAGAPPFQFP